MKTAGQEWRWKRNLTIAIAAKAGISQRHLADVFGIARSGIPPILAAVRAEAERIQDRRERRDD